MEEELGTDAGPGGHVVQTDEQQEQEGRESSSRPEQSHLLAEWRGEKRTPQAAGYSLTEGHDARISLKSSMCKCSGWLTSLVWRGAANCTTFQAVAIDAAGSDCFTGHLRADNIQSVGSSHSPAAYLQAP